MRRTATYLYICLGLVAFMAGRAWAHGIVGPRFFPEPVITEDAFPSDEGDLRFHRRNTAAIREQELEAGMGKRITPNLGLDFGWGQRSFTPNDPTMPGASGLKNPEITLKYVMVRSPDHEWLATSGLGLETGNVGKPEVGADFNPSLTPHFFFGKGFGDLPDVLRYLKPLAIGGHLGLAVPLSPSTDAGDTQSTFISQVFVEYSLLYLQTVVKDIGLGWPFNRLFPITEFDFTTLANGPSRGRPGATVHPGVLWAGRYIELAVVADLPLNKEAEVRGGVSALLHLFLDDMAPRVFRPIIQ